MAETGEGFGDADSEDIGVEAGVAGIVGADVLGLIGEVIEDVWGVICAVIGDELANVTGFAPAVRRRGFVAER